MTSTFPAIVSEVGLPDSSLPSVLKCPVLNPASQFLSVEKEGRLSPYVTVWPSSILGNDISSSQNFFCIEVSGVLHHFYFRPATNIT
jgi:hypothetical protein